MRGGPVYSGRTRCNAQFSSMSPIGMLRTPLAALAGAGAGVAIGCSFPSLGFNGRHPKAPEVPEVPEVDRLIAYAEMRARPMSERFRTL